MVEHEITIGIDVGNVGKTVSTVKIYPPVERRSVVMYDASNQMSFLSYDDPNKLQHQHQCDGNRHYLESFASLSAPDGLQITMMNRTLIENLSVVNLDINASRVKGKSMSKSDGGHDGEVLDCGHHLVNLEGILHWHRYRTEAVRQDAQESYLAKFKNLFFPVDSSICPEKYLHHYNGPSKANMAIKSNDIAELPQIQTDIGKCHYYFDLAQSPTPATHLDPESMAKYRMLSMALPWNEFWETQVSNESGNEKIHLSATKTCARTSIHEDCSSVPELRPYHFTGDDGDDPRVRSTKQATALKSSSTRKIASTALTPPPILVQKDASSVYKPQTPSPLRTTTLPILCDEKPLTPRQREKQRKRESNRPVLNDREPELLHSTPSPPSSSNNNNNNDSSGSGSSTRNRDQAKQVHPPPQPQFHSDSKKNQAALITPPPKNVHPSASSSDEGQARSCMSKLKTRVVGPTKHKERSGSSAQISALASSSSASQSPALGLRDQQQHSSSSKTVTMPLRADSSVSRSKLKSQTKANTKTNAVTLTLKAPVQTNDKKSNQSQQQTKKGSSSVLSKVMTSVSTAVSLSTAHLPSNSKTTPLSSPLKAPTSSYNNDSDSNYVHNHDDEHDYECDSETLGKDGGLRSRKFPMGRDFVLNTIPPLSPTSANPTHSINKTKKSILENTIMTEKLYATETPYLIKKNYPVWKAVVEATIELAWTCDGNDHMGFIDMLETSSALADLCFKHNPQWILEVAHFNRLRKGCGDVFRSVPICYPRKTFDLKDAPFDTTATDQCSIFDIPFPSSTFMERLTREGVKWLHDFCLWTLKVYAARLKTHMKQLEKINNVDDVYHDMLTGITYAMSVLYFLRRSEYALHIFSSVIILPNSDDEEEEEEEEDKSISGSSDRNCSVVGSCNSSSRSNPNSSASSLLLSLPLPPQLKSAMKQMATTRDARGSTKRVRFLLDTTDVVPPSYLATLCN
ncbi:hypothetical protein BG011_004758 [Mortierella polycephala]|uniref:Uncharacterized protein n=1 Tax=Mortierella polycephala TaxID=41804 RepID=A0A9P6PYZ8_9FUNG|nr:hypothetical protein BG011_004758 [Mortierella polycephala]